MTAQDIFSRPCSSPTILGRAVATIIWSSAASSRVSISPRKTMRTLRGLISTAAPPGPGPTGGGGGGGAAVSTVAAVPSGSVPSGPVLSGPSFTSVIPPTT
ncbi:hypothetical protein SBADM41S_08412 [Streptomyces badius]